MHVELIGSERSIKMYEINNGGFDQGMADAQWDNHPDNPANADDEYDADWLYEQQQDDLAEHMSVVCRNLGA
jgi:hypothetical protein